METYGDFTFHEDHELGQCDRLAQREHGPAFCSGHILNGRGWMIPVKKNFWQRHSFITLIAVVLVAAALCEIGRKLY